MNNEYLVVVAAIIFLTGIYLCIRMIDDAPIRNQKHL